MGGELHAKLFVGPCETKTYYDWIVLLLKSRKQIIDEIKQENAYKKHMKPYREQGYESDDDDEDVIISDWYISDGRINEDIEKLGNILYENKMFFVHSTNMGCYVDGEEVRIGMPIQEEVVNPRFQIPQKVKDFWEKYGISDIVMFAGMY